MSDLNQAAQRMLHAYDRLLDAADVSHSAAMNAPIAHPYNLLVTDRWMMLVPRTRETFESISLNALAFAGALLVRNRQELDMLVDCGPMHALRHVTSP
jgi:ATP adenylyltransferase